MNVFARLLLAASFIGFIGLGQAHAASTTSTTSTMSTKSVTIVFTDGLGTILTGVSGIDRTRNEAVAKRLTELRAKYSDALFADGGDALGPLIAQDTQYGLPTYRLFFDENRYAAAALSTRDGLHTASFFQFLPPYAKIATPLVGTFAHATTPTKEASFYQVRPAWARAEAGGAKFQFFGVATTRSLTGIEPPYLYVQFGGDAKKQARYVLDNLLPGHTPIILSDMTPAENDTLAKTLNRNALIYEGGYPWHLVHASADQKPTRDVGAAKIISHFSPFEAEVVTLPPGLECKQAKIARKEILWEPKQSPASPGLLSRLLYGRPLETALVRTLFTETLHLPDVATSLGERSLLAEIEIPYDDKDAKRVPPLDDKSWHPPLWMEKTRNLRGNAIVYRYELYYNKKFRACLYRIHHDLVPNFSLLEVFIAVDKDHRLYRSKILFPTQITHLKVRTEPVVERLRGKGWKEIRLEDWPERAGAEFMIDNLVRDIQMALAFDEMAD